MRTLLVSAPCGRFPAAEDDLYDAPLGVLALAAVLEKQGSPVSIVDPDRWRQGYAAQGGLPEEWVSGFAAWLAAKDFEIFGFSTMCSSFPATLRIATALKGLRSDAAIILGGPQASVTDEACMREFRCVDYVVRGEADETLPLLIDAIGSGGRDLDKLPGVTFRAGGVVRRNAPAPPVRDLDALPLPAYHLLGEFETVPRMALELGRGCPFACRFCSTNDFFRRNFRLKSPAVMIEQMRMLEARYGTRVFSLVHDMFTVNRRAVVAFCEALIGSGAPFEWSCSARTDCVDRDLLRLMNDAGCQGVFFGIETGSARLQKIIDKNLDLAEARESIQAADENHIATTISLITGFPEETEADLRDTLAFLLDSARFDSTAPQLHLLAPLAGTPIEQSYRGQLTLDRASSDISEETQSAEDLSLIGKHLVIFPNFCAVPCPGLDREFLGDLRSFILFGLDALRWLFVALHQTAENILDVYRQWLSWRRETGQLADFRSREGVGMFLTFAGERYGSHPAVGTLVAYYRGVLDWRAPDPEDGMRSETVVPVLSPDIRLVRMPGSLQLLLEHMQRGDCNAFSDSSPDTAVVRRRAASAAEVVHIAALGTRILELCDGARDLAEIAVEVSESGLANHIAASAMTIVAAVCSQFRRDGLISFRSCAPSCSQERVTPESHAGALTSLA